MKVLSFGSLNIDFVYTVPRFVAAGETLASTKMETFCGGKGLNQSIALARAGGKVFHAGAVGPDGEILIEELEGAKVDTHLIKVLSGERTGHAIIQKNQEGENCILLYGGANQKISRQQIDETLAEFGPGDWLILQNEISELDYLMKAGRRRGLTIVLNPSPMDVGLAGQLDLVDYLILNEVEMGQLMNALPGAEVGDAALTDAAEVGDAALTDAVEAEDAALPGAAELKDMLAHFPDIKIILTLGKRGAIYADYDTIIKVDAVPALVVDTTGAGDTFTGYFVAQTINGGSPKVALELAARAAAISVGRSGAANSIPTIEEVLHGARGLEE